MTATALKSTVDDGPTLRPDRLVDGIVVLLVLNVLQRLVGLGRGVVFCQLLSPEQLGQWDLALGFLATAAPVLVFGLPGSFGRYVEYYRQRGQLKTFLVRVTLFSCVTASVGVVALFGAADTVSVLLFGDDGAVELVYYLAGCVFVVVAFNYLAELFTGLRLYRFAAFMQALNSLLFAAAGIVGLLVWSCDASSIVMAYATAGVAVTLIAAVYLFRVWPTIANGGIVLSHGAMWRKLVPFAAWVWIGNWLTNLFIVVDRYMLVHCGNMSPQAALDAVGQYHTSRIIPVMLLSIVTMIATALTPQLSHEWELGRRQGVSEQLNLALKLTALGQLVVAIGVMLAVGPLFSLLFDDKFNHGLAVLPWTMTHSYWFGLTTVGTIYLWCAEKAKLGSLALAVGLATNVALNLLLLPRYGLLGTVLATSVANLVALVIVLVLGRLAGFQVERSTALLCALPGTLWLGPWVGVAMLFVVFILRRDLFTASQVRAIRATANRYGEWLGRRVGKRPVASAAGQQ